MALQLIDFNHVEVVTPMIYPPRPALVVGGMAPSPGAEVSLVPLDHVGRPPYWGIQVVCTPGTGTGSAEYSVQIDLAGITGVHGVELIGATRTARIDVSTETEDGA